MLTKFTNLFSLQNNWLKNLTNTKLTGNTAFAS